MRLRLEGLDRLAGVAWDEGTAVVVGRDPAECSLVLDDHLDEISRRHCTISVWGPGEVGVTDDGSMNGTQLEDRTRLEPGVLTVIPAGSVVYLGSTSLGLRLDLVP